MTRAILAALAAHWRRSPLQLVTLIAGLALGTGLWSGVQAINAEARASYDAAAATLGETEFAQITADGGPIPEATFVALRRAGWLVSPVVEGRIGEVRLVGIEPLTAPGGLGPVAAADGADLRGFLTGAGQVFARPEVLALLEGAGVTGIAAPGVAPGTAVTDIGVAQRLLGRGAEVDRLIVAPGQPAARPPLPPGLTLQPPQDRADMARLTDSFRLNLTAFGLLSFAVGLFIVHGAIGLAFEQRRVTVRTMRALGVPLGRLIGLMVAELAALALVAGAVGVALGYAMAALLLPDVAATLRGLYGAEVSGQLTLRAEWWLSGLGIALAGTAVAGGGALWALARMPLLASAQPVAWVTARRDGWMLGLALGLLAVAGTLAWSGGGLVAGFAMLGAMLVGGALALPPVLSAALRGGERLARGPVAQWFWADTRQQLPGLSLALMALLLAMTANVGVSTMVSSFRLTFAGFLDQRLASELYVSAADAEQAQVIARVAGVAGAALLPVVWVEAEIAGQPAEIYGARDHATYRQAWVLLQAAPGAWDLLAAGQGALVNEQLFRRAGLGIGATVAVAPGRSLPVVGVYGDYGNPVGQVIVTLPLFETLFPEAEARRFGLRTGAPDTLRAALVAAGIPAAAIIDQAAIKALSMEIFDRTFTVTAALNVLTLAVAGFALLMSLLTLAALRLPQVAPPWALGLTRARIAALDLARAVMLAALTAVLALPLGLALAWALLAVVNVEAFGWRLPMHLFPADWARLFGLTLLAAALAALWPAWRLARVPPAQLLGVFRHER